ncbi:hypothetical protein ALP29_200199 [Pseudomonas syringae pv. avii]|uniref:Uncharacterized protein n=1 Tax=Pseudomonas syringae pv. avii TaxID=663959 RepID=A0A3M5VFS7_PSESX|nr:hypothetical protein ALP29_200199 [Pseudomonas syringae pv. avii]
MQGQHTGIFDDDMRSHAEALSVIHRSCGTDERNAWGRDLGIY